MMLVPKCIYPKCIFAKCTRLACLLSFASLIQIEINQEETDFFAEPCVDTKWKAMSSVADLDLIKNLGRSHLMVSHFRGHHSLEN